MDADTYYEIHPICKFEAPVLANSTTCATWMFLASPSHAAEGKFFSADPRPGLTGYSYARHACVSEVDMKGGVTPATKQEAVAWKTYSASKDFRRATVALGFTCHFSFSDSLATTTS